MQIRRSPPTAQVGYQAKSRVERRVPGRRLGLAPRRARHWRDQGRLRCGECRLTLEPRVTPALRRWWLDRYSLDEIRELTAGLNPLKP